MGPGGQLLTPTLTLQFFPIKSNKMSYKWVILPPPHTILLLQPIDQHIHFIVLYAVIPFFFLLLYCLYLNLPVSQHCSFFNSSSSRSSFPYIFCFFLLFSMLLHTLLSPFPASSLTPFLSSLLLSSSDIFLISPSYLLLLSPFPVFFSLHFSSSFHSCFYSPALRDSLLSSSLLLLFLLLLLFSFLSIPLPSPSSHLFSSPNSSIFYLSQLGAWRYNPLLPSPLSPLPPPPLLPPSWHLTVPLYAKMPPLSHSNSIPPSTAANTIINTTRTSCTHLPCIYASYILLTFAPYIAFLLVHILAFSTTRTSYIHLPCTLHTFSLLLVHTLPFLLTKLHFLLFKTLHFPFSQYTFFPSLFIAFPTSTLIVPIHVLPFLLVHSLF